jgi:DivIVA domain-containing protein
MALDRHSVMRSDFPMSRRGYDRIAVDRHLDEIAQEIEALERPSVGATASARVQTILDAAEASAAEIERQAWEQATRTQEATDNALARAREHITALGAASRMLQERIDGLVAEVELLEGTLGGIAAEPEPADRVEAVELEPQDTMAFDPILEDEAAVAEAVPEEPEAGAPVAEREGRFGREHNGGENGRTAWFSQGPPAWSGAGTQTASTQQARESARLVALNMADGGQPREVTDGYLAELFAPAERAALLDEIYGGR